MISLDSTFLFAPHTQVSLVVTTSTLLSGIEKKFDKEPQPQRVPVGGVAWFQCQIHAVPPAIYIWERNGTHLPQEDSR